MNSQQLVQKIVAETTALMSLKVDNEHVVQDKIRTIRDRLEALCDSASEPNEIYNKAFAVIETAMDNEYKQFTEAVNYDEKEQILILLRHRAAEVCEILQAT